MVYLPTNCGQKGVLTCGTLGGMKGATAFSDKGRYTNWAFQAYLPVLSRMIKWHPPVKSYFEFFFRIKPITLGSSMTVNKMELSTTKYLANCLGSVMDLSL